MIDTEIFKKIKRIEIVSKHLVENVLSGNYLSTFHGQGLEFAEVREYVPGDEVRLIDWNVTARMQKPYVKIFQEEREMTLMLAIDVSASTDFGSRGVTKRELAAQVAATLGFAAAVNGDRVGFIFFSDQVEVSLPPKAGKKHVLRAVRDLLALQPKGKGSDFAPALARLKNMAKHNATVFLLSDFQTRGLDATVKSAAKRYDLIACNLKDPSESEPPRGMGLIPCRDPETGKGYWLDTDSAMAREDWKDDEEKRMAALEKDLLRMKVDIFAVCADKDLMPPLVHFFKKREKRLLRV